MPKYEISIAVCDEPEPHRKKEGDVVSIIEMGMPWGRKVLDEYLIVPVLSNLSYNEIRQQLMTPWWSDGLVGWPDPEDDTPRTKLGKNRFKIPLDIIRDGWYPALDYDKVRNKGLMYQPLKKKAECISDFKGSVWFEVNSAIECDDIDQEITLDMSEKVSICFDKYKGSYLYSTKKVAG